MDNVKELLKEIKTGIETAGKPRCCGSKKDETSVMRAMLNDKSFKVGVYNSTGKISEYCPAEVAHNLVGDVIANATKISKAEASDIAENYSFTNSDANKFVQISKEFVNVYTDSGRKLNLGRREDSNVSLFKKHLEAHERNYPKQKLDANGNKVIGPDGKAVCEKATTQIPAHTVMRATSKCPDHLK